MNFLFVKKSNYITSDSGFGIGTPLRIYHVLGFFPFSYVAFISVPGLFFYLF